MTGNILFAIIYKIFILPKNCDDWLLSWGILSTTRQRKSKIINVDNSRFVKYFNSILSVLSTTHQRKSCPIRNIPPHFNYSILIFQFYHSCVHSILYNTRYHRFILFLNAKSFPKHCIRHFNFIDIIITCR